MQNATTWVPVQDFKNLNICKKPTLLAKEGIETFLQNIFHHHIHDLEKKAAALVQKENKEFPGVGFEPWTPRAVSRDHKE